MVDRSFRVSPLRLAILGELAEGLRYECGSGDWPMEEAEATIRKRIEQVRSHYGDAGESAREALAAHISSERADERRKVLAEVAPEAAVERQVDDADTAALLRAQREWFQAEDRPLTRAEHEECLERARADERRKVLDQISERLAKTPTFVAEYSLETLRERRAVFVDAAQLLVAKLREEGAGNG